MQLSSGPDRGNLTNYPVRKVALAQVFTQLFTINRRILSVGLALCLLMAGAAVSSASPVTAQSPGATCDDLPQLQDLALAAMDAKEAADTAQQRQEAVEDFLQLSPYEDLRDQVADLESRINEYEARLDDLKTILDQLEESIDRLTNDQPPDRPSSRALDRLGRRAQRQYDRGAYRPASRTSVARYDTAIAIWGRAVFLDLGVAAFQAAATLTLGQTLQRNLNRHEQNLDEYRDVKPAFDELDSAYQQMLGELAAAETSATDARRAAQRLADDLSMPYPEDLNPLLDRISELEETCGACPPEGPVPEGLVRVDGECYPAFVPIIGWDSIPDNGEIFPSVEAACEHMMIAAGGEIPLPPYPRTPLWSHVMCDWEGGLIAPTFVVAQCPPSPAWYVPTDYRTVRGPEPWTAEPYMCESRYNDYQHPAG